MARAKLKFRLHRTAIILICLALLVLLMQGASYFSLSHQMARSEQVEELAQTLTKQVAYSLAPLLDDDGNTPRIDAILKQLTDHSRILDVSVYQLDGTLVSHAGEQISIRDRLSLDGKRAGSYFNHQLVESIQGKDGPIGFIRITLDTHVLATESAGGQHHQSAAPDDPAGAGDRHHSGAHPAATPPQPLAAVAVPVDRQHAVGRRQYGGRRRRGCAGDKTGSAEEG